MRKFLNIILHLIKNFNEKHRLSFNSLHKGELIWQLFISPLHIFFALLAFLVLIFTFIVLLMAYTPVLDLLPGYPGNKSRELLLENIVRLDSLQRKVEMWDNYRGNLVRIMDGREPLAFYEQSSADSTLTDKLVPLGASDAELEFRKSVESADTIKRKISSFNMVMPVKGVVTRNFALKRGDGSIEVSADGVEPVLAVNDGTVIFSAWTPEYGSIIQIQHGGNMVSTYKRLSKTLKDVGDQIRAGEVLGYIGDDSEEDGVSSVLELEIWSNGNSVDPENYLIF